jgi:hypothetical protein
MDPTALSANVGNSSLLSHPSRWLFYLLKEEAQVKPPLFGVLIEQYNRLPIIRTVSSLDEISKINLENLL